MIVKYVKLSNFAKEPTKNYEEDACYDLYSNQEYWIYPNATMIIPTDIAVEIPKGYEGRVRGRSGLASRGIEVHHGTIDSNYRGNLGVIIHNLTNEAYHILQHARIAQFTIKPVYDLKFELVSSLEESKRGDKGFGSSGE